MTVTEPLVANARPVAVAGPNQFINVTPGAAVNVPVTLDGSASIDANNDVLTYKWTLSAPDVPSGSTAVLSSAAPATAAKPVFVANVLGTYVATLVVNDTKVDSEVAQTRITVSETNVAPVASATATPTTVSLAAAAAAKLVTLDGGGSTDVNRDALTYTWTMTSFPGATAPALTVDLINKAKATFTPTVAGVHVITLVVSDGKLSSPMGVGSTVVVTATP